MFSGVNKRKYTLLRYFQENKYDIYNLKAPGRVSKLNSDDIHT